MADEKKYPFEESKERWYSWRNRVEKEKGYDPISSLCMWEFTDPSKRFKLECWNVIGIGPVIFQFWPDGNGFSEYVSSDVEKLLPEEVG